VHPTCIAVVVFNQLLENNNYLTRSPRPAWPRLLKPALVFLCRMCIGIHALLSEDLLSQYEKDAWRELHTTMLCMPNCHSSEDVPL
jgi:hypothetical protein